MKSAHAIQTLWQHAAPHLPDSALEHLACTEDAAATLRNIAQLMEDLGRLIGNEGERPAADFRASEQMPTVLFGLASVIATQAELLALAGDAAALRRLRATGD